jgi:hypothetical protein
MESTPASAVLDNPPLLPVAETTEEAMENAGNNSKQTSIQSVDEEHMAFQEEPAIMTSDEKNQSFCGRFHNAFAGFLFPRLTPIPPAAFFVLSLFAAIP